MDQQLLETLRVIALPTKTNFRGITVREVALFKGPYGWGEFSPFLEYDDAEAAHWLASALEAATTPRPQFFRTSIAVNGTIPATNDKKVVDDLIKFGTVQRAFLGIRPEANADENTDSQIKEGDGVVVGEVMSKSAAEDAGLKKGDVVVSIAVHRISLWLYSSYRWCCERWKANELRRIK